MTESVPNHPPGTSPFSVSVLIVDDDQDIREILRSILEDAGYLVIWEHDSKRYVGSVYGIVDWVRNLRAAKEAMLTRGRRSDVVKVTEPPQREAALVLRDDIKGGNPFASRYGVAADSALGEFERAVLTHPIFLFETK